MHSKRNKYNKLSLKENLKKCHVFTDEKINKLVKIVNDNKKENEIALILSSEEEIEEIEEIDTN